MEGENLYLCVGLPMQYMHIAGYALAYTYGQFSFASKCTVFTYGCPMYMYG